MNFQISDFKMLEEFEYIMNVSKYATHHHTMLGDIEYNTLHPTMHSRIEYNTLYHTMHGKNCI